MCFEFKQPPTILEQPTQVRRLAGKDLKALANYIKSDDCRNVFLMLGAGVSTSAGIPDFRSPDTGLYAKLDQLELPHPEAVFDIDFFRQNPVPFYTLAKELYPRHFQPTPTHSFIKVLDDHSRLHTCFTQNIDTLERKAGIPVEKIVEAHGSFATQSCIDCRRPYDDERMREAVAGTEVPLCDHCDGLVKPDIVFFGEAMPKKFYKSQATLGEADLLIVIGTSLAVHPFALLPQYVGMRCPRVLINLEEVGFFHKPDDLIFLGKCDDIIRELCHELGWEEELDETWNAVKESGGDEGLSPVDELDEVIKEIKSLSVSESRDEGETKEGGEGDPSGLEDDKDSKSETKKL